MLERCPGCTREVSDFDVVCPACGFRFVSEKKSAVRRDDEGPRLAPPASLEAPPAFTPPPRPRPSEKKSPLLPLLGAALCAAGAWSWFAGKETLAPTPPPAPIEEPPETPASEPISILEEPTPPPQPAQTPQRKTRHAPRAPVAQAALEKTPLALGEDFRIRGFVYDLFTLKPVGGAEIIFSDIGTGRKFEPMTDKEGRFRVHLPVNEKGYSLRIHHADYEARHFEDEPPAYRSLTLENRKVLARELLKNLSAPPTHRSANKAVFERAFALIPRNR